MRKVTFLFAALAAVVMIGCTKPEDNNGKKPDPEEPKPQKEFSFTMTLNEWYKENPNYNYSNIYIGKSIPLDIIIKDTDPEKNIIYILKPVNKTDAKRHQVFGKDFELYKYTTPPYFTKTEEIRIKSLNDTLGCVAIINPIVPGLFQLDFQLQKYDTITKKYIGDPVVTRASAFHVVKIIAELTDDKFEWRVLDGEQQSDTYLSNYSVAKKYDYEFKCGKVKKVDEFKEGYIYSIDLKEFGNIKDFERLKKCDLKITQYLKDGGYNEIEYKNITIKK